MPCVSKLAVLCVLGTLPVLAAPASPARNLPLTIPATAARPQLAAAQASLLVLRLVMSPHPQHTLPG